MEKPRNTCGNKMETQVIEILTGLLFSQHLFLLAEYTSESIKVSKSYKTLKNTAVVYFNIRTNQYKTQYFGMIFLSINKTTDALVPDNKICQIAQAVIITAWHTLVDKFFCCGEGNNLEVGIFEPLPPDPAVLDISAALSLMLSPPVGALPSQLQGASCMTDCGSKLWLCLQHLPLIQEQS